MVQIEWTLLAMEDLKSIYDFIARGSRNYAKIEVIKIKSRTVLLKVSPLSGKILSERNDSRIREIIYGNYRIIYKIIS